MGYGSVTNYSDDIPNTLILHRIKMVDEISKMHKTYENNTVLNFQKRNGIAVSRASHGE